MQWLTAVPQAIADEEDAQNVCQDRKQRGLSLTSRAGLLAGYPDTAGDRRLVRKNLSAPKIRLALPKAVPKRVVDAPLSRVTRREELALHARSERVSRDAAQDLLEPGGLLKAGEH